MNADEKISDVLPIFREYADVRIERPSEIAVHQHHDYEFLRILSGTYECHLNDVPLTLGENDALLVKPGDTHWVPFETAPVRYQMVSFYLEDAETGLPHELFVDGVEPSGQRLHVERAQMDSLMSRLGRETLACETYYRRILRAIMEELFWVILRWLPPETLREDLFPAEDESERFRNALLRLFADTKHQGKLPIDEIAQRLHMSRRNVTRKCREHLGTSPARAFLRYRLGLACEMLRHTTMSCQQTAVFLGFANPYHFSSAFKRTFGIPPQLYRDGEDPHGERVSDV